MKTRVALAIACLLTLVPSAAADAGVVGDTYEYGWGQADDFARCGWEIARTPFIIANQSTVFVDVARNVVEPVRQSAVGQVRQHSDGAAAALDKFTNEDIEKAVADADREAREAKCAAAFYASWAAHAFVWKSPVVSCWTIEISNCGNPNAKCNIDFTFDTLLWPFDWWPFGSGDPLSNPPKACVPPTGVHCVTTGSTGACIPPPGPGRFRCVHTSTILGCVQGGV